MATTPLTRTRGGTFSPTVATIRFTDGTEAHTDLIRLTPNVDGYSLDFHGRSPRRLSHYRDASWQDTTTQDAEDAVTWILAHSFPHVGLRDLSDRLQAAGYEAAGLKEHEAIAATQAAIWSLTNGLELDTRRLGAPAELRAHAWSGTSLATDHGVGAHWAARWTAGGHAVLELALPDAPQLRGYALDVTAASAGITVTLERSLDGRTWAPVSGSRARLDRATSGAVVKNLGHGTTLASTTRGGVERGYAHYRLIAETADGTAGHLDIADVRLRPLGARQFANDDRIVYLYDYLSRAARATAPLRGNPAVASGGAPIAGPFVLDTPFSALTFTANAVVVDEDGFAVRGPVDAGVPFHLALHDRRAATELAAFSVRARTLIGSSTPSGPAEFTPVVALATGTTARTSLDVAEDTPATRLSVTA